MSLSDDLTLQQGNKEGFWGLTGSVETEAHHADTVLHLQLQTPQLEHQLTGANNTGLVKTKQKINMDDIW